MSYLVLTLGDFVLGDIIIGDFVLWDFVQKCFCPRGLCPRGFCHRGFCPRFPHCSLTAMLLNNGGNSKVSQTIKILFTQLSNYKLFGAPKIPHILLTKSEISHVRSELFDELNFCEQSFPVFLLIYSVCPVKVF